MKFFRHRKPSLKSILGLTKAKKRTKKNIGITAMMKPFRAPGNLKRRILRRAGYYSTPMKIARHGFPTLFGLGKAEDRGEVVERQGKAELDVEAYSQAMAELDHSLEEVAELVKRAKEVGAAKLGVAPEKLGETIDLDLRLEELLERVESTVEHCYSVEDVKKLIEIVKATRDSIAQCIKDVTGEGDRREQQA